MELTACTCGTWPSVQEHTALRTACCHIQVRSLFERRPCIFHVQPHSAAVKAAWFCSSRVWELNWTACSSNRSPLKIIWYIINWIIRHRRPRTVGRLESSITHGMGQDSSPKPPTAGLPSSQMFMDCCWLVLWETLLQSNKKKQKQKKLFS